MEWHGYGSTDLLLFFVYGLIVEVYINKLTPSELAWAVAADESEMFDHQSASYSYNSSTSNIVDHSSPYRVVLTHRL